MAVDPEYAAMMAERKAEYERTRAAKRKAEHDALVERAKTDPEAARQLAEQRKYQSEATVRSYQKMKAAAEAGDPEAIKRYFNDPRPENMPLLEDLYNALLQQEEVVQDQVWGRVTTNRAAGKSTRYYMDEFHLLLKEEQTAAYSVEIWKRFRKWGGIPTGITQNVKDLLSSYEVQNIFENSDFVYMLNQAAGDRQILAKQLNISPHQLSYVTHSGEGEGLLFFGNVILPFVDRFPQDLELYRIMTTKLGEVVKNG